MPAATSRQLSDAAQLAPGPSDADFVAHALRLRRTIAADPLAAKMNLFALIVILADREHTTPSGVLEKLARSAPSRADQYALMRRYRAALEES